MPLVYEVTQGWWARGKSARRTPKRWGCTPGGVLCCAVACGSRETKTRAKRRSSCIIVMGVGKFIVPHFLPSREYPYQPTADCSGPHGGCVRIFGILLCLGWPYAAELAAFVFPHHRGWKVQLLDKESTSVGHRFARSSGYGRCVRVRVVIEAWLDTYCSLSCGAMEA